MQHCPIASVAKLYRREEYGVEVHIVLPHELIQLHVLGVEPPLFPFAGIIGGDTRITDWRIELS